MSRQRLSAEARRDQLERAALVVVADDGYAAANADAIARTASASKGLVWHYYTDLTDLLVHAARRALRLLEAAVAAELDLRAPLPKLLRAAIGRAARLPATHARELRAIRQLVDNLRDPAGHRLLRDTESEPLLARQAALLRRGQQEGHLRADLDPQLLAVTYQGLVDTMVDHLLDHPDVDPDRYAVHVATVLLEGIAAPDPPPHRR
ncbi:TetR family transcriptional regulator [Pseudonocardia kujensis]|uniref:TetR family transcriptional regulator n=1 Tax=Pseudonocardia kujensis TaxID=1128675 RepID=UPI001E4502EE|nr:TetR family transcriptional regulator [Pseudonocardia kujensis]MCE0765002.1 TetR family transcriptional regulator [Pseudonocardia kujensis]